MIDLSLGNVDDDLDFDYESSTQVFASCGASLHGEMFVLGGQHHTRQVCINNQLKSRHLSAVGNKLFLLRYRASITSNSLRLAKYTIVN